MKANRASLERTQLSDGVIEVNSEKGKIFGFTKDKFEGYLWKNGDYIYISFIISLQPNQKNLSQLFDTILKKGYGIKGPTPFPRMENIVKHYGFKKTKEWFEKANDWCEVWVKDVGLGSK